MYIRFIFSLCLLAEVTADLQSVDGERVFVPEDYHADLDDHVTVVHGQTATDADVEPDLSRAELNAKFEDLDIDADHVDVSDAVINATLDQHRGIEFNVTRQDSRMYYEYSLGDFESTWVDLDDPSVAQFVVQHQMLSGSHRRADTIQLSFPFMFYGHVVKNITIATGGFLYVGDYVHSWLAATQYIAPLMANFDTSQDEDAIIRYLDANSTLVVEWRNVRLSGTHKLSGQEYSQGPFTFQAILHGNGDIDFAYKAIPVEVAKIKDPDHPVKVGLSDAYIIERTIFLVKRKTIYEYDRLELMKTKNNISPVRSKSVIHIKALTTCNMMTDCDSCLRASIEHSLNCKWCPKLQSCSDGTDRRRQEWMHERCELSAMDQMSMCLQWRQQQQQLLEESQGQVSSATAPASTTSDGDLATTLPTARPADATEQTSPDLSETASSTEHLTELEKQVFTTDDAVGHSPFWQASDNVAGPVNYINSADDGGGQSSSSVLISVLIVVLAVTSSAFAWFAYAYFFPHTTSGQILIRYRPSRWHLVRSNTSTSDGGPIGHSYSSASLHI